MVEPNEPSTASAAEVARFQAMADQWWESDGSFAPLHALSAPRLSFLRERLAGHFGRADESLRPFEGLTLLDIGCGGGLLSEPAARLGFSVVGIDAGDKAIAIARTHARAAGLDIDYRVARPEEIDGDFDVVTAFEVVEHVPDLGAFLAAAARRLKPGGVFLGATLNRTARSFAEGIVAAEYLLGWLPRGTHAWRKFVRPSELATALRQAGIRPQAFEGIRYDPVGQGWHRHPRLDVNYMVFATKP